MSVRKLATAQLGVVNVNLLVNSNDRGGSFACHPTPVSLPAITIGLDYDHWHEVVIVLLHEVVELAMLMAGRRFEPSTGAMGGDRYIFQMTHAEFTDVSLMAGCYIAAVWTPLFEEWTRVKQKRTESKQHEQTTETE